MSFPLRAQRAVESGLSSINTFTAMTRGPGEEKAGVAAWLRASMQDGEVVYQWGALRVQDDP